MQNASVFNEINYSFALLKVLIKLFTATTGTYLSLCPVRYRHSGKLLAGIYETRPQPGYSYETSTRWIPAKSLPV